MARLQRERRRHVGAKRDEAPVTRLIALLVFLHIARGVIGSGAESPIEEAFSISDTQAISP